MRFPKLENYLSRLAGGRTADASLWTDGQGRVQGRFYQATLTSAFQPLRMLGTGAIAGYEGFARTWSEADPGLNAWRLLDSAASDDESVALDRLCRMLHAINFFRQPHAGSHDLYLSVHARLLAAVETHHGLAFRRVLDALGLPQSRIVLQLPSIESRRDLLGQVVDNYRRSGFRVVLNAARIEEARVLALRLKPEAVKLDARSELPEQDILRLQEHCTGLGVRVLFKRVERLQTALALARSAAAFSSPALAQGFLWDLPTASLAADDPRCTVSGSLEPASHGGAI